MKALYAQVRRLVDLIDGVLITVGSAMLFALMLVVVADVALRYLLNSPLQWSYDVISSYLMPGLFFLAVSHTLKSNGHVAVDIIHNYLGRRARYVLEAVATLLAIPAFGICAWMALGVTLKDFHTGATSSAGLAIPTWTVSLLLPLGFGLLALRLAANFVGYVLSLASGEEVLALPVISGSEGAE